eukprot:CAMPEP_0204080020 /NCGR_PEP_ID=MMETSP0360-20130528/173334_1 /ASSEMBLY_ACC=CAM_ASM_000342 /TAXON_ID=268821 /ORGANISM="Scrippsiella Hangoei, Strain SHTV-5" /LENGTH=74 /DNA_ID=CAMNT_0051028777 /DNA_START=46 /DNA_END=266 /DNA_ORIENTATION=-
MPKALQNSWTAKSSLGLAPGGLLDVSLSTSRASSSQSSPSSPPGPALHDRQPSIALGLNKAARAWGARRWPRPG